MISSVVHAAHPSSPVFSSSEISCTPTEKSVGRRVGPGRRREALCEGRDERMERM